MDPFTKLILTATAKPIACQSDRNCKSRAINRRVEGKSQHLPDRLNSSPAREQELADLSRGYDQSKANYDELLKKQNASTMATNMEQMQQR